MEYIREIMSSPGAHSIKMCLLKALTQDFSENMKIGSGGYGEVYKGVLNGSTIAVKKLFPIHGLDDEAFENKMRTIKKVRHKNVIEMIGYCYVMSQKKFLYEGKLMLSQVIERAVCFEYVKEGSLAKHISAESCIHDWPTTYKIIYGTCDGLHHLHNAGEQKIFHLDLKPDNVLLDEQLVPKIGDFGRAEASRSTHSNNLWATTAAMVMSFEELNRITNGFSEERLLGKGAYGRVYKGVLDNGEVIAVKKLYIRPELVEASFKNELVNLMTAQHQNIIRLVGYCYETKDKVVEHEGKSIVAVEQKIALCLEYMQGGTVEELLSDEVLDWKARYKIIKGICQGLKYLHTGSKDPMYHLDLKLANILLDKDLIPKIGDFGLSRLLASTGTFVTQTNSGTRGYMPPEYMHGRKISSKFDVYSLGVIIIQIIAGPEGHYNYRCLHKSDPQEFTDNVTENWSNRVQANTMSTEALLEVQKCIKMAIRCVEDDREKRPTITEIVEELNMIDLGPLWC